MSSSAHRIRSLRWQARGESQAQAFALRRSLRDGWQSVLLAAFERECDGIAEPERVIRIARLELRLKAQSERELSEALPGLIRRQLMDSLRPGSNVQERPREKATMPREFSAREDRYESLLHYLRTGRVPWHAVDPSTAEAAVRLQGACREHWPKLLGRMLSHEEAAAFYFRLLQILSLDESESLIGALSQSFPRVWGGAFVRAVTSVLRGGRAPFSPHLRLTLAAAFLREGIKRRSDDAMPDFASIAENVSGHSEKTAVEQYVLSLAGMFRRTRRGEAVSGAALSATSVSKGDERPVTTHPHAKETSASLAPNETDKAEYSEREEPAEDLYPLTADCAGLILVHPFLPGLFENAGIKPAQSAALSTDAIPRAAALLHFVATGREEAFEWELGFIKVILGLNPASPLLVAEGLLASGDKEEAEAMLQSVIHYWSALKGTSLAGLRSSFLQRRGLLREDEGGWRLSVEERSFDVLLDRLPWGISVVRLPWMKKAVYTEWRMP